MGRSNSPFPKGERCKEVLPDGATMTYDIFQPEVPHKYGSFICNSQNISLKIEHP
jgi:hypothetical protein